MKKSLTLLFVSCAILSFAQSTVICSGNSASLIAGNPSNLSNPTYSIAPGGTTSSSGVFIVSPSATTSYTLYTSGMNGSSMFVTTTSTSLVTVSQGPTFSMVSPQNYTLGCSTKSAAVVHMVNAQTIPSGGAVSFTVLYPGTSVGPGPTLSPTFSYTLYTAGSYTAIARDNSNGCDTKIPFSVISNTTPPVIDSISQIAVLNCTNTSQLLNGYISSSNTEPMWILPNNTKVVTDTLRVWSNTTAPTATSIGVYTFVATDLNNLCKSSQNIGVFQNLFAPQAKIVSSTTSLTCNTPSIVLSNNSLSKVPPQFFQNLPVVAILWTGPGSSPQLTLSSSYTANIAGTYTMEVMDHNNGCKSSTIISITDKIYPALMPADPIPLCGTTVTVIPNVIGTETGFTYTWVAPSNANVQGFNSKPLITDAVGVYTVHVQNLQGCISTQVYTVDLCTGLDEQNELAGSYLFPNPTSTEVTIRVASGTLIINVQVFDAVGKLIVSRKIVGSETIDLSTLSRGVYLVRLQSGNSTNVLRLIKD